MYGFIISVSGLILLQSLISLQFITILGFMKDLDRTNIVFFGIGTGVAALVSSLVYFTDTALLSGHSIFFSIKYVTFFS